MINCPNCGFTTSKEGMTRRQKDAFDFIKKYRKQYGYPPSYEEIAEGLSLQSKSGVHRLIVGLVERGLIGRHPGRSRSLVVL